MALKGLKTTSSAACGPCRAPGAVAPSPLLRTVPRVTASGSAEALEERIRAQMEENQRRRQALRAEMAVARSAAAEAGSVPWWEVDCPPNMVNASSPEHLTTALAAAAAADQLAVVHFFSPECYACRSLQPKLRQIARGAEAAGAVFVKVNGAVDGLREYCEEQGVAAIPYFHFYKGGARVAEFSANMTPAKLSLLRRTIDEHTVGWSAGGGAAGDNGGGSGSSGAGAASERAHAEAPVRA